jgi:hypothetical protein
VRESRELGDNGGSGVELLRVYRRSAGMIIIFGKEDNFQEDVALANTLVQQQQHQRRAKFTHAHPTRGTQHEGMLASLWHLQARLYTSRRSDVRASLALAAPDRQTPHSLPTSPPFPSRTYLRQDLRVDQQNVAHSQEGGDARPDLGGHAGVSLFNLEKLGDGAMQSPLPCHHSCLGGWVRELPPRPGKSRNWVKKIRLLS